MDQFVLYLKQQGLSLPQNGYFLSYAKTSDRLSIGLKRILKMYYLKQKGVTNLEEKGRSDAIMRAIFTSHCVLVLEEPGLFVRNVLDIENEKIIELIGDKLQISYDRAVDGFRFKGMEEAIQKIIDSQDEEVKRFLEQIYPGYKVKKIFNPQKEKETLERLLVKKYLGDAREGFLEKVKFQFVESCKEEILNDQAVWL